MIAKDNITKQYNKKQYNVCSHYPNMVMNHFYTEKI